MWKFILTVIALGFTIAPACAENQFDKVAALHALSGEYLECSAYFSMAAYCMAGYPSPIVPKIVSDYRNAARTAFRLAISTGRVVGAINSSVEARSKPVGAAQTQSVKSDCLNISDQSERYGVFCKQLMQGPDRRTEELLAGRYCTGLYRCSLSASSAPRPVRTGY